MPTAIIDLTRLKKLHCGLGQFALHLGQSIQAATSGGLPLPGGARLRTEFLLPHQARPLLMTSGSGDDLHTARWWQREAPRRSLGRVLPLPTPRADVWHTIDHLSTYAPRDRRTPVVLTIHDLNFPAARTPRQNRRSLDLLQRRIDRATLLTTGSHFAAHQIRQQLDVAGKELRVIYHGLCVRPERTVPRPHFAPDRPFLFSIGEFRPFKNFHTLPGLLARLPDDLHLVIAGNTATPYAERVRQEMARYRLERRITLPGVVTDDERHWLYEHCQAFVFPSLAEGFGLPAIEAMSFGKPVFLADATSLPEVGGLLAFYWNDYTPEAMAAVFERGMSQFAAAADGAKALRAHAARFTWPQAAANYLQAYGDVLAAAAGIQRRAA